MQLLVRQSGRQGIGTHSYDHQVAEPTWLLEPKASALNHCRQSVARSWKPMCSSRLLQTLGRSPKSPRMFLSLAQCHNPLANSERPKNQKQTAPRVFTAPGATCFKANKLRTILAGHLNAGIDRGVIKIVA